MEINGVINIYKEKAYTSHDVVARVRRILGRPKTGHTGTLDPNAEGVLPICVGKATKIADFIMAERKTYRAVVVLGKTTDTEDVTGAILEEKEVCCSRNDIIQVVDSFKGEYQQTPPMYSAIKIGGKKLYRLARRGEVVERNSRTVNIFDIEITSFFNEKSFQINVSCSKGTYIRTLVADIGKKLGCGAYMDDLIRLRSGIFILKDSIKLSDFEKVIAESKLSGRLCSEESFNEAAFFKSVSDVLSNYRRLDVKPGFDKALYNGNQLNSNAFNSTDIAMEEKYRVFDQNNRLVGIYCARLHDGNVFLKPVTMLI